MFFSLYEVQISQGHLKRQSNYHTLYICAPNNNFNATCHTSDLLLIWGNLNSKTQHVQPYYDQSDILHSQMLNDMFGPFFRTSDPNPDPAFLKVRGPAYAATYEIYGRNKYRVPVYHPKRKTSIY